MDLVTHQMQLLLVWTLCVWFQ